MQTDLSWLSAKLKALLSMSLLLVAMQGTAAHEAILEAVPEAGIVGSGTFSYFFWDIYDATLYAPNGQWDAAEPYALSIEYKRAIAGADIADRSVYEIRKQGFADEARLSSWHEQMLRIFPDVDHGTALSAVHVPGEQTTFHQGGRIIGIVDDDEFARCFFGIWLDEKTSAPALRRALLGLR